MPTRERIHAGNRLPRTEPVNILNVFGLIAVSTMLIAYALERRSPSFVLLFAAACAASSVYGFLAGTWPFGAIEAIWTAVAVRRWSQHTAAAPGTGSGRPIACDMRALSTAERERYDVLRPRVLSAVKQIQEMPTRFSLRIGSSVPMADVAEWVEMERRCCAFLDINVSLRSDNTMWIEIGGTAAIKAFVKEEFGVSRSGKHQRS